MMSIGQSRAQIVHLMQRSASRRNMPRKRSAGSQRSSGYSTVSLRRRRWRPVIPKPAKRSRSITRSRNLFSARIKLSSEQDLHQAGREDVEKSERQHPLPAQLHQLIEAIAREGATEPDVQEEEAEDLEEEPERRRHQIEEAEGFDRSEEHT